MAKALGLKKSGMTTVWSNAMKKAPSAQHVYFSFKKRELVFYKEVDSGKT